MARPLTLSVLMLSAAALGYEVLLLRLFSIAQWHHFAYMVISLALLGYGAAGTFLALARRPLLDRFAAAYPAGVGLFAAASVACFAAAQRLPFNPLELAWDPGQLTVLAGIYLLLALPFFGAAGAIGLALARLEESLHRVYAADLAGAGLGAAGAVGLLFLLPAGACLEVVSALGVAAAGLALADRTCGGRRLAGALTALAALAVPALWPDAWSEPRLSPYKGLAQALRVPGARVIEERSSPLGRLTVVESRQVPFRHAPGLSLAFPGEPPEQLAVFTDADALTAVTRAPADLGSGPAGPLAYLDHLPSALPYHLLERPRVLVPGAGGGSQVLSALVHGAREVDAVEVDAQLARLVRETYGPFAGHLYDRPGVRLHVAEARGFLARSEERYDLIQLDLVDSFAAAAAGAHALAESYLYTVEALRLDLRHLAPGGYLAFTRWLDSPPRDALKLFATAVAALEAEGVADPGERMALIRGWSTATLLVGSRPLGPAETAAIRAFSRERSFDVAYLPDLEASEVNRFNVLDRPYLYEGALALLGPERDRFLSAYKFHLAPATDERPYFFRFFKWRALGELLALRGRGGTPLIQWSYLILAATLAQAVAAGALLVLAPLALARRRMRAAPGSGRMALYFLALGVAFLFAEIALLHRFTLFLAHPLYAAAVVLGSFLLFAGLGSAASRRLVERWSGRRGGGGGERGRWGAAALPALGAAALIVIELAALPPLFRAWAGLPDPARIALSVALLAPLAFLMGMPFPLGLARAARRSPEWLPWAWGINGCASVASAVGATLLAVHAGFAAVLAVAALLYVAAAWLIGRL